MNKALSYWQVAFQYLDLSENVSKLIADSGNKWCVVQSGTDEDTMIKHYRETTKWTDYNQGIPVLFNFYHGIELLLKGFIVASNVELKKNHSISVILNLVKKHHPEADFPSLIEKYIHDRKLPNILKEFVKETSISIDEWYQAFKYPESINGDLYAHSKLQFRKEDGAYFFNELSDSIHQIRSLAVKYARDNGYA